MSETTRRATYETAIDLDGCGAAVEALRKPLNEASHVPGLFYTAPEVYALEKERIFLADWLAVGREEEIASPGDFRTYRLMDEPFIVARNREGVVRAYVNRCAHRGVAVAQGSGNARGFVCPYHGWGYDLDGRLTGAPDMNEAQGFERQACRLRPLQSAGGRAGSSSPSMRSRCPSPRSSRLTTARSAFCARRTAAWPTRSRSRSAATGNFRSRT